MIFEEIKNLIRSQTSKDASLLFLATIISVGINFILVIFLTNKLEPADFGLFITALTFSQLVIDMFELGLNPATLNFLSKAENKERNSFLTHLFLLKLTLSSFASILVFFLAKYIANIIFKNVQIAPLIQISAVGVFFMILINWGQSLFQSEKNFFKSAILNVSPNIFRLIAFLILLMSGTFFLTITYLSYNLVLIFSLVILLLFINFKIFNSPIELEKVKKIFSFGLPIGLGFMLAAISTRLDQLMLFNLAGNYSAGIYGLAFRLTTIFVFLTAAFASAITPRFVSLEKSEFNNYFKKTLAITSLLCIFSLITIIGSPLIPLIFGQKYQPSIQPFQILMIGIIFFILSAPFITALTYRYKKTKLTLILSLISLGSLYFLLNQLIPQYQALGAAIAVSTVYIIQFLITLPVFFVTSRAKL